MRKRKTLTASQVIWRLRQLDRIAQETADERDPNGLPRQPVHRHASPIMQQFVRDALSDAGADRRRGS